MPNHDWQFFSMGYGAVVCGSKILMRFMQLLVWFCAICMNISKDAQVCKMLWRFVVMGDQIYMLSLIERNVMSHIGPVTTQHVMYDVILS